MFDIKKEEQEIQNNFISFPDFMRLFTNKNPDVSLKKIVRFINNKIPDQYYFNVVFIEDDFLKIEDAFTNIFWDYLFSFENSETLGKDAELHIYNADFDGYYLYKNEVTSLLDIPSELLDKNLLPISKSDTITNNNTPDEIAHLNAIIEQQTVTIARLEAEVENLKKPETAQATHPPTEEEKQNRISYPQRALFSLLLSKMYPNGDIPNTNALKESINVELKKIGYREISITL